MFRRTLCLWLLALTTGLTLYLGACGNGIFGGDDVEPGACALGPTLPLQPQVVPSRDAANQLKIYLLRGLDNVYSLGLDKLASEMGKFNCQPVIVEWPYWDLVVQQIVTDGATSKENAKYMLVGHSYGADDAIRTANVMKEHGMEVQLLFLLDATSPDPIPDNVIHCIHYYEPWLPGDLFPDFFSGNPVVPAPGNTRTKIENLIFSRETLGDGVGCADHFSIDANQLMHNLITTEALKLMTADPVPTGG